MELDKVFSRNFVPKERPTKLGEWGYHIPTIKKELLEWRDRAVVAARQEWLDRFKEELKSIQPQHLIDSAGGHIVIQAIRRTLRPSKEKE